MSSGEQLSLSGMKKEFNRLSKKAEAAQKEVDEYLGMGSEFIAIHNEFVEIVESGEHGEDVLKKLQALQCRRDRIERIRKKDLLKIMDKQNAAEWDRDALGSEIRTLEFRLSLRGRV